jgi:putative DNA primase/helicase
MKADNLETIAERSVELAAEHNVYFGMGLHPRPLGSGRRGEVDTVSAIPGIWIDLDYGTLGHKSEKNPPTIEDALSIVEWFPLEPGAVVHSGYGLHAHWPFRELWTLETEAERQAAIHLVQRFQATLRARARGRGWEIDSTFNVAQVLRLPGTWNRKLEPVEVRLIELRPERRYNPDDFEPFLIDIEAWEKAEPVELPSDLPKIDADSLKVAPWIKELIRDGGDSQHYKSGSEALWRIEREMIENAYDDATIAAVLLNPENKGGEKAQRQGRKWLAGDIGRARKRVRPTPDLGVAIRDAGGSIDYRVSGASDNRPNGKSDNRPNGKVHTGAAEPPTGPPIDDDKPEQPPRFATTDLGNSERYVTRVGAELLYCKLWGDWSFYDRRRWKIDTIGYAITRAKQVVRGIYVEAAEAEAKEERRELAGWARKSESEAKINAMVSLARSALPVEPSRFDTDPWLLNVRNGTLDLRTGELREHRRDDYLTKLIDLDYDPAAACPMWLAFLERVLPDEDVRRFVQRGAGYSATGSARERKLLIPYGSGKNGKGVFLQTLKSVLGEYAVRAPSETFMAKRDNAIPNDIAALRGARFVFASETNEGHRLAEATIKDLTGGEEISARFMRGEWFSFAPTFTPWLATNHRPIIRGSDPAIWDRIGLIPFTVRIPDDEQDPELLDKLKAEYPGILTWIVRGAAEWYRQGLKTPAAVREATGSYQAEMDVLGTFLSERCVNDQDEETGWVLAGDLYEAYTKWCEESGEKPMPKRTLGLRLAERGYTAARVGKARTRGWIGLRLMTDADIPSEELPL